MSPCTEYPLPEKARIALQNGDADLALRELFTYLREERGISQREMAEKLAVSQPAICKMEKHPYGLKISTFIKYAEAMECKVSLDIADTEGREFNLYKTK